MSSSDIMGMDAVAAASTALAVAGPIPLRLTRGAKHAASQFSSSSPEVFANRASASPVASPAIASVCARANFTRLGRNLPRASFHSTTRTSSCAVRWRGSRARIAAPSDPQNHASSSRSLGSFSDASRAGYASRAFRHSAGSSLFQSRVVSTVAVGGMSPSLVWGFPAPPLLRGGVLAPLQKLRHFATDHVNLVRLHEQVRVVQVLDHEPLGGKLLVV